MNRSNELLIGAWVLIVSMTLIGVFGYYNYQDNKTKDEIAIRKGEAKNWDRVPFEINYQGTKISDPNQMTNTELMAVMVSIGENYYGDIQKAKLRKELIESKGKNSAEYLSGELEFLSNSIMISNRICKLTQNYAKKLKRELEQPLPSQENIRNILNYYIKDFYRLDKEVTDNRYRFEQGRYKKSLQRNYKYQ